MPFLPELAEWAAIFRPHLPTPCRGSRSVVAKVRFSIGLKSVQWSNAELVTTLLVCA
jgi:hypothetical protein